MEAERGMVALARVVSLVLFVGCAPSAPPPALEGEHRCASDVDCPLEWGVCRCDARCYATDDGLGRREDGPETTTVAYMLTALRVAPSGTPGEAFGLDLDPTMAGCAAPERVSPRTGAPNIDNQTQALMHEIEQARGRSIALANLDTRLLAMRAWAIEVRGIDDFEDDCQVEVRLSLVQPTGGEFVLGSGCTVHGEPVGCGADVERGCLWSNEISRCIGLREGQGARTQVLVGVAPGRIANGVLHTQVLGEMQLELTYVDQGTSAAQLIDTRIDAEITPTSLSGELGARIEVNNLLGLHSSALIPFASANPERTRARLAPDLMPDASGACTHASAGFAFSAIPLTLVP